MLKWFLQGKTILQIVLYGQDQFGGKADFKSAIYDGGENIICAVQKSTITICNDCKFYTTFTESLKFSISITEYPNVKPLICLI